MTTKKWGPDDNHFEFDNALWIKFSGGYGQFVESDDFKNWPQEYSKDEYIFDKTEDGIDIWPAKAFIPGSGIRICHECAHELCDKIPWIKELINPHASHAHKVDYIKDNPDHYGWDYDSIKKNSS